MDLIDGGSRNLESSLVDLVSIEAALRFIDPAAARMPFASGIV